MKLLYYIFSIILSILSTIIMSYISMAMPIGPWIEPTLVLSGMIFFSLILRKLSKRELTKALGLTTVAGGIGGILATALGFSFPTLYFLDPEIFNSWMANSTNFAFYLFWLSFSAGSFGFLIANIFEKQLIVKENMAFAVGELVYKMISAKNQIQKAISLGIGFVLTKLLLIFQFCSSFLPSSIFILQSRNFHFLTIPNLVFTTEFIPMFLAIGFVTGHVIAKPLFVGLISKMIFIKPLYNFYPNIFNFLDLKTSVSKLSYMDYLIAFCSGMVLINSIKGFIYLPISIFNAAKEYFDGEKDHKINAFNDISKYVPWLQAIPVLLINIIFLSYFNFSFASQLYLLFFTFICTYQLLVIAGQIGLAPLGRFATFVLIPGLFLFGFDAIQITFVSSFVEIAGGVGCDVLFGRKMSRLASIDTKETEKFQWLGLLVSSLVVGIVFWLFISTFGLGNIQNALPVTKAASRALLINFKSFDLSILLLGMFFGYFIKFLKVNPMLILGGILMPDSYSIMLIIGGLMSNLMKNKEDYYPFWSGVFAANSIWMLIKAFLPYCC